MTFSTTYMDHSDLCRLCLLKEGVNIPIFQDDCDLSTKINECLPFKVSKDDKFSKKICVDCLYKLETFHQFCNVVTDSKKQWNSWYIEEPVLIEDPPAFEGEIHLTKKLLQKKKAKPVTKSVNKDVSVDQNSSAETIAIETDAKEIAEEILIKEEIPPAANNGSETAGESDDDIRDRDYVVNNDDSEDYQDDDDRDEDYKPSTFYKTKKAKKKKAQKRKLVTDLLEITLKEEGEKPPPSKRKRIRPRVNGGLEKVRARRRRRNMKPLKHGKIIFCDGLQDGVYKCNLCSKTFEIVKDVKSHYKETHMMDQMLKCEFCEEMFRKLPKLVEHRKVRHGLDEDSPIFYCDKCNYSSKKKYYLEAHHVRKHTDEYKFDCDICGKKFKLKEDVRFHMDIHGNNEHMCDICGRFYPSVRALTRHRRVKHINSYNFPCTKCRFKSISQHNLDNHMRDMHNPENPHKCDVCGQQFERRYYLSRHKRRVHKKLDKPHLCTVCGKSFVCMNTFRIHYLTHTKIRPYVCNVCGDNFSQRTSMMLHWKKKHPDAGEPPPPVILTNVFETLQLNVGESATTTPVVNSNSLNT